MATTKRIKKRELQAKVRLVQEIFKKRGVTTEEADIIWDGIATLCVFQIERGIGAFADVAKRLR